METMKKISKTLAGLMAVVMVLLGLSVSPVEVDASIPETVYYDDDQEFKIKDYWAETVADAKAPVKDGYVFGGWYMPGEEAGRYVAINQADIVNSPNRVEDFSAAVAKFVPSYVLSVRTQLQTETEQTDGKGVETTYLRVLSAVDSVKYMNVGFDVLFNKKTPFGTEEQKKTVMSTVYKSLTALDDPIYAKDIFGSAASLFSALKIEDIKSKNFDKVIYVTPYWTTKDGTKVEGLSKYVRISDGYASNKLISIPVNLLSNVQVAAGMMQFTYDANLQYVGWDKGVLFPEEMNIHVDTENRTIRLVGNVSEPGNKNAGADIYANVWFRYTGTEKLTPNTFEFTMNAENFCNWDEYMYEDGEVIAWDVRY